MYIGAHMKRSKYNTVISAINGTIKLGGNFLQIFAGNHIKTTLNYKDRLTNEKIKEIKNLLKKNKMKIVIHGILTLNFCSPISRRYRWNSDNLIYDLHYCQSINALGVIIHMGTFITKNFNLTYKEGENNFVKSIINVIKETKNLKAKIILETSCNQTNKIGGTLKQFANIYNKIAKKHKNRIGICVDTAHVFSAGYNINTVEGVRDYFNQFNKLIGIEYCTLIHLNDSMRECCSCVDRHESIGKGYIFSDKLGGSINALKEIFFISYKHKIPIILETSHRFFKKEIKMLKDFSKNVPRGKILKGGKKKYKKSKNNINNKTLMKKNIKEKVLKIFNEMYEFHSKLGNNGNTHTQFRAIGYRRAIDSLKNFKGKVYSGEDVKKLSGFGQSFVNKVDEIAKTGTLDILEKIKKDPKIQARQLFQNIIGIGPKISNNLVMKHKLYSIKDLKKALKEGKVKLNETQLLGLKYFTDLNKRVSRKEIEWYKKYVEKELKKLSKDIKITIAGSYRIGKKDSGDIDMLVVKSEYKDKNTFMEESIKQLKKIIVEVISRGRTKYMVLTKIPNSVSSFKPHIVRKIDLVFITKDELPWYLLYFGSDLSFSRKIRDYASKIGFKLNERGLYDKKTNKRIDFNPKKEKEIFEYLGLEYIKPKDRPYVNL